MALKTDIIHKALSRKVLPPTKKSQYSHFSIHKIPSPTEPIVLQNKLDTNRTQTKHEEIKHKLDTNRIQIEHNKIETNIDTNFTQSEHKNKRNLDTNCTQTKHHTEHKVDTYLSQTRHDIDTNRVQSEDIIKYKFDTNLTRSKHKSSIIEQDFYSFSNYIGVQKNILILFYSECKTNRSKTTSELTVDYIANALNIPFGSVKTSVKRLETKGAIRRIKFKNGRGGWSKYELNENIYREIMQLETEHKINTNRIQTEHKQSMEPNTNSTVYSSSNININTTTDRGGQLPEEWQSINTEPLKEQGFSINQIKQLYALNITTPEVVQDSINRCAFSLEHNPKYKDHPNPINLLMGILRKGQAWVESNYQSPQEIALRELIERKRAEQERLKKLEEEAFDLAVEEWGRNLSPDEINNITQKRGLNDITPKDSKLRLYFKENIWATVKKDYLI